MSLENDKILKVKIRLINQPVIIFVHINFDWRIIVDVTRREICSIKNDVTKHINGNLLCYWQVDKELFHSLDSKQVIFVSCTFMDLFLCVLEFLFFLYFYFLDPWHLTISINRHIISSCHIWAFSSALLLRFNLF